MERSLLALLERAAARFPDKRAYADEKNAYTFAEMLDTAQRIGSALSRRFDTVKAPVAVYLEKSAHCVAAYFGVLCSGALGRRMRSCLNHRRLLFSLLQELRFQACLSCCRCCL